MYLVLHSKNWLNSCFFLEKIQPNFSSLLSKENLLQILGLFKKHF